MLYTLEEEGVVLAYPEVPEVLEVVEMVAELLIQMELVVLTDSVVEVEVVVVLSMEEMVVVVLLLSA